MKKPTKAQAKIRTVMHEFKTGELHSGKKGPVVKNRKQAIAIALSQAGKSMGKAKGGMWIQGAVKHPGALRSALKAKTGEPIPAKKLQKAAHSKNPTLAKRANLALTLRKMNRSK